MKRSHKRAQIVVTMFVVTAIIAAIAVESTHIVVTLQLLASLLWIWMEEI